jgi:hypothetical protein
LSTIPRELSEADVNNIIIKHGFFERFRNPAGRGYEHEYRLMEIFHENFYYEKIVCDDISGLIWQQSGSKNYINYKFAEYWIDELNRKSFADIKNWRLPTLEEAMSLIESQKNNKGMHIDPIFNENQMWIWTSDRLNAEYRLWFVNFHDGMCQTTEYENAYIRAVSSTESPEEYFEKVKCLWNKIRMKIQELQIMNSALENKLKQKL